MIRRATADDSADVLRMLATYLTDIRRYGSDIRVTPKTMGFYGGLLGSYLDGSVDGVCLVVDDSGVLVGMTMAGFLGDVPWDTDHGKQAFGWGTWVAPSHRRQDFGTQLRERLVKELRGLGFDSVIGSVHAANKPCLAHLAAAGREPYCFQVLERLQGGG